jgi:hypothetical protein
MASLTTEDIIRAAVNSFRAPRGSKTISTSQRTMSVRTPGERVLHLPNGTTVKITTDDSGIATQVEETDRLHAVVRPHTHRLTLREMR